jgi:hypothetical protein
VRARWTGFYQSGVAIIVGEAVLEQRRFDALRDQPGLTRIGDRDSQSARTALGCGSPDVQADQKN